MNLGRNFFAGILNSVGMLVVGLAVVPFYLEHLGVEAYGLIGFFAMTQSLLQLLDLGLAPTIIREVARFSALGSTQKVGDLLHSLAVIYWVMAGLIAVTIFGFSSLLSEHWLQSRELSRETLHRAVALIGLVIACRWPIGLYRGALIGAERLAVASFINIGMMIVANFGAVGVLMFVSPTIEAFFIWQGAIGLIYAIVIRVVAWRVIGRSSTVKFDLGELKRVWRFTTGMTVVAVTGLIFTQLDKVLLSRMLSLDDYGIYMLATVVVSGLYALISPVFSTVYPRMSALVAKGDVPTLTRLYRLSTRFLCVIVFPVALVLAVFPEDLVLLWTGNDDVARGVAPIIVLLAIGTALHGVMHLPYALQLGYGATRIPLTINFILLIVLIPMVIALAFSYGALGGAMAWLVLQVLYVLLGTYLTHKELLRTIGGKWLAQDVGVPLGVALVTGSIFHLVGDGVGDSALLGLALAILMAIATALLTLLASPALLGVIWRAFKTRRLEY